MPRANGFLLPHETASEKFFRLCVVACSSCTLVQLTDPVPREVLFPVDYAFRSSTSSTMAAHFERLAGLVQRQINDRSDPLVAEIGSNDGILLRHLAADGIRHLGIEPSEDVANVARALGVDSVTRFFDAGTAEELMRTHGQADAIVGANVICHIADIHGLARGIALFLKPDGLFIFEDPYLGDILRLTSFDQMYDEHVFYFSLASVQRVFEPHGLEVIDVEAQPVHGGSMRYVLAHKTQRPVSDRVFALAAEEMKRALWSASTYESFRVAVSKKKQVLRDTVRQLRRAGQRVVGYAATSKSCTTINYCGLSANDLEYICDTTPGKVGRVSPGAHIPIVPYSEFAGRYPDVAVLFAWNHEAEIRAKEQIFLSRGGAFLSYVPAVSLMSHPARHLPAPF